MRITKENFQDEEFQYELFLTTSQKTKIRNTFSDNMLMNIKLTRAQLFIIIQYGGFSGALLSKFDSPWMKVAKNVLAPLVITASVSATDSAIK